MFLAQELLAQGEEEAGGGGLLFPLLMIVGLFAIFYFMLIRPQRRRRETQQRLQSSLSVGDEVVTVGGLYGTVAEVDERTVILETSEGVYSRYARAAIAEVVTAPPEAAADTDTDTDTEAEVPEPAEVADQPAEPTAEQRDGKD